MTDELEKIGNLMQMEADSITSLPITIPFQNIVSDMLPHGVEINEITITPLTVGTVGRINPLLLKLQTNELDKITVNKERPFDPGAPRVFEKYTELILDIIVLGIHNKMTPAPEYLKEFIKENTTWMDLHLILNAILFRMGALNFYESTISAKLMGPKGTEIIAVQENLKSWEG